MTTTAFVGATVVPMDEERLLARQTVLVDGDRIVAIGPMGEVDVPSDASLSRSRGIHPADESRYNTGAMNVRSYALAGVPAAPAVALGIGVWAEFAHLTPPLLLAVALPAMAVSLLSAAYLARATTRPLALLLLGGAIGLLTFSLAAGLYIAIHYLRGEGLDLNGDSARGSAGVFFAIHVAVGTIAGLALGVAGAAVLWMGRALRAPALGTPRLEGRDSSRSLSSSEAKGSE